MRTRVAMIAVMCLAGCGREPEFKNGSVVAVWTQDDYEHHSTWSCMYPHTTVRTPDGRVYRLMGLPSLKVGDEILFNVHGGNVHHYEGW